MRWARCFQSAGFTPAAVGVFASMLIGYDNVDTTPFVSIFPLACVPGATVEDISRAYGVVRD